MALGKGGVMSESNSKKTDPNVEEYELERVPKAQNDTGHDELYVVYNGVHIAKRGHPGTPQAETWVALEPGYRVFDGYDLGTIVIEYNGMFLQ